MHSLDANLLLALDALLTEGTVVGAARRMGVSAPAMSRTLGRIRAVTEDPILVLAGRKMVTTPRAERLRDRVRQTAAETRALLSPAEAFDLKQLRRVFRIRASDAVVPGPLTTLLETMRAAAPLVTVVVVPEGEETIEPLREGTIDLDVGLQGRTGPELKVQRLFRDELCVLARKGHPLTRGRLTSERLAAVEHVVISRRGKLERKIDGSLAARGLTCVRRRAVPSFFAGAWLIGHSPLVAVVPRSFATAVQRLYALTVLPLPSTVAAEPLQFAQMWHPRFDRDPAHQWLRQSVARAFVTR